MKPKIPAKIEEPPPAKGIVLYQKTNMMTFVLIAISMPSVWMLPEFCEHICINIFAEYSR